MLLNKKDFFFSFIVYKENENGWNKIFLPHSDMVLLLISYYTNQILILS